MIRTVGGATTDGHTVTIRPFESNVIDPHSDGGSAPEVACRLLPSGPGRW